jgi:muramoyltetrapeptide carboxypeptidase LdcA involved in peptidoglycan recycling
VGPERAGHRHGPLPCGGYRAARLYNRIDWDRLGEPRIFCGFSDITALHLALARHGPWTTFYGPNFLRFTRITVRLCSRMNCGR